MSGNTGKCITINPLDTYCDYYDGLDKYRIDNRSDIVVKWIFLFSKVGYKDDIVNENYINTKHAASNSGDRHSLRKAVNRVTYYH